MKRNKERGLWKLYASDPEKADAELWDRAPENSSRRSFLKNSGVAALTLALSAPIPFFRNMPAGLIPVALADTSDDFKIPGKHGLIILNDRPLNAETPPHLLDNAITPNDRHFVRNNGHPSGSAYESETSQWILTVDGEVHRSLTLSLDQLKRFKQVTYALQVECGGNGRAGFNPPAKGNQWSFGAIGCARYTGVRLGDVLREAGLKDSAVYTGYYGSDLHLSGDPNKVTISRGTPIAKAMDPHTLLAWAMNGKPLPPLHGYPLRVVTPGWPGSTSAKWLKRIRVRDRVHDGPKMGGYSYRIPKYKVLPGTKVPKEDMKIIESMPVKSLITQPKTRLQIKKGQTLKVKGHAWAGDRSVSQLHVSYDFGATWIEAKLNNPVNPYAWQDWQVNLKLPENGYYEVWARATDSAGVM